MTGVKELFAEYDGSDRDDFQLQFCFERLADVRRERHRESQRLIDWRKRGGPPKRRGGHRPRLYTADQIRARRKEQNRIAQGKWREKQRARAA